MNYLTTIYKKIKEAIVASFEERYIDKLIVDVSEKDRPVYKTLLQNELNWINQASAERMPSDQIDRDFMMRLTKRIIDRIIILGEVVGIQPMSGPVGLVYNLRVQGSDDELRMEIVKDAVVASARKLCARWNIEPLADAQLLHPDIDFKEEMISMLAHETADEIIAEVVNHLYTIGQKSNTTQLTNNPTALLFSINKLRNEIAAESRRGAGNFVITNAVGVAMLQAACISGITFKGVDAAKLGGFSTFLHAGDIVNDGHVLYKVYMTTFIETDIPTGTYVIGYKGSGHADTGYVYAPYIPLALMGTTINAETFTPEMRTMTRYGKWTADTPTTYYKNLSYSLQENVDPAA